VGFLRRLFGGANAPPHPQEFEAAETPFPPGHVLCDDYVVRARLGQGGMGEVYLVENMPRGEMRAAKIMRGRSAASTADLAAFRQEALSLLNVGTHPFVVQLHDLREQGRNTVLLMEYVPPTVGCTTVMDYICRTQDYSDRLLGAWAVQFCVGMEHAIKNSIEAHRDIKPANLFVDSGVFLKIGDFGLALAASHYPTILRDTSGQFRQLQLLQLDDGRITCGTPGYIAPELMTGSSASQQSDMFSFGVTLWQLATRTMELPYDVRFGDDVRIFQNAVLSKAIAYEVKRIDSPFFEVIYRCLCPDPTHRYSDFPALREAIKDAMKKADLGAMDFMVAPGFQGSFENYLNRGKTYLVLGRRNRAFRILDKAVQVRPDSFRALCARGEALHQLGDTQGAIRDYQAAHHLKPGADAPLTGVALTLLEHDRVDEATKELEKVLARHPANLEAKLLKARALSVKRNSPAALTLIDQVLSSDPEHVAAHEYRGRLIWQQGDLQGAAKSFHRTLHLDPFRLSTHLALCALLTAGGNYAEADAHYVHVQQLFKRNPEDLNQIAAHMAEHGHASKAIEAFSALAEMEPASRSTMLVNTGNAYLRLNKVDSALKSFKDALKVDPNNALAFRRFGDFEDEHGSVEKAAEYFARACELEPDNPSHHACAGTAYLRLQEYERATFHLRKSLAIFPNQPHIHYNLAAALVYQGLAEDAVDELAKATRLDPLYARAWYLKAQIELRLSRVDDLGNSIRHALRDSSSLTPEEVREIRAFADEHKLIT